MADIYILHEPDRWTAPLIAALTERGLPYRDWHLDKGTWSLLVTHPNGQSCLVAAGEAWENLPLPVKGQPV